MTLASPRSGWEWAQGLTLIEASTPGEGEPGDTHPCRGSEGRSWQVVLQSPSQRADYGTQASLSLIHSHAHTQRRLEREEGSGCFFQNEIANCQSSLNKELTQATGKGEARKPWRLKQRPGALLPLHCPASWPGNWPGSGMVGTTEKGRAEEGLKQNSGLPVHSRADEQPSQPGMEWG